MAGLKQGIDLRGAFLKKLWCWVGGKYYKVIWFYQLHWWYELILIFLQWPIHIINPAEIILISGSVLKLGINIFVRVGKITEFGFWEAAANRYPIFLGISAWVNLYWQDLHAPLGCSVWGYQNQKWQCVMGNLYKKHILHK